MPLIIHYIAKICKGKTPDLAALHETVLWQASAPDIAGSPDKPKNTDIKLTFGAISHQIGGVK